MENRFNLIDEAWIPVVDIGRVGLRDIFTHPEYRMPGGNPVQKIAIIKLLLAIAQAAATPADEREWRQLGWQGMANKVCAYLEQWHHCFCLYGQQPFLQMPAIAATKKKPFSTVLPDVATGNTTVLTQSQWEKSLDDADKALLLLTQMGLALGGKKTDNSVVLSPGYQGKSAAGKPGPAVAYLGLLHNYCLGSTLLKSIWFNLFTQAEINQLTLYPGGLGVAPWERMPQGEECEVARQLKRSLMGRLIPLCRFCLLGEDDLHYSEGIAHGSHKEGSYDPSIAVNPAGKEIKARWVDPERRPWRELTGLLSFIVCGDGQYECIQLRLSLPKACQQEDPIAIWSGGLRVSNNAGEQYVSGSDDMVDSLCWLYPGQLGEIWFNHLKKEMDALDKLGTSLYRSVMGYFKALLAEGGEQYARKASHLFWQLCERECQALLNNCDKPAIRQQLRRQFARYASQVFDQICPRQTARQMDAWARTKPNFAACLKKESE